MKKNNVHYSAKDIRNIRMGSLLLMLGYVFIIFIPLAYTWLAEIPPFQQLQVISGELTYKDVGKRGDRLTGVKTGAGAVFFTCSDGKFGEAPDCLFPYNEYEELSGSPVTVWWFEQPVYPFVTQNKLVQLVVDGEEKLSYEKTLVLTLHASDIAPWFAGVLLILFVLIVILFERRIRRQGNG